MARTNWSGNTLLKRMDNKTLYALPLYNTRNYRATCGIVGGAVYALKSARAGIGPSSGGKFFALLFCFGKNGTVSSNTSRIRGQGLNILVGKGQP